MRATRRQAQSLSRGAIAIRWLHRDCRVQVKEIAEWLGVFPSAVSRVMLTGRGGDQWLPRLAALAKSRGLLSATAQAPAADQTTPREPDTEPQVRCHNCNGHKQPLSHFGATGHFSVMEYEQDREEQDHRDASEENDDDEDTDEDQGIGEPELAPVWRRAPMAVAPASSVAAVLARQTTTALAKVILDGRCQRGHPVYAPLIHELERRARRGDHVAEEVLMQIISPTTAANTRARERAALVERAEHFRRHAEEATRAAREAQQHLVSFAPIMLVLDEPGAWMQQQLQRQEQERQQRAERLTRQFPFLAG